jgi:hypothetical protein
MKQSLNSPLTLRMRLRLIYSSSAEKLTGEFSLMYTPEYGARLALSLTRCGDGLLFPITVFRYWTVHFRILALTAFLSRENSNQPQLVHLAYSLSLSGRAIPRCACACNSLPGAQDEAVRLSQNLPLHQTTHRVARRHCRDPDRLP